MIHWTIEEKQPQRNFIKRLRVFQYLFLYLLPTPPIAATTETESMKKESTPPPPRFQASRGRQQPTRFPTNRRRKRTKHRRTTQHRTPICSSSSGSYFPRKTTKTTTKSHADLDRRIWTVGLTGGRRQITAPYRFWLIPLSLFVFLLLVLLSSPTFPPPFSTSPLFGRK